MRSGIKDQGGMRKPYLIASKCIMKYAGCNASAQEILVCHLHLGPSPGESSSDLDLDVIENSATH
jgi:hypothetical protein